VYHVSTCPSTLSIFSFHLAKAAAKRIRCIDGQSSASIRVLGEKKEEHEPPILSIPDWVD
jgi:hypothetical protein